MMSVLQSALDAAGGWLGFDAFMALALYTPGLGYYASGSRKFGHMPQSGSDFVTAPELSPHFGRALARQVAQALQATGVDEVWEFGAGSGALAGQVMAALDAAGTPLRRYTIVDLSGSLRERQQARLAAYGERVRWVQELPATFSGVVLGNEVLDAMPVQLLARVGGVWRERGVALHAGAMPRIVNITILNALGVSGALAAPPTFTPTDAGGAHLDVRFAWGADLWPWSGWLGVYLRAAETGVAFTGTASGTIKFTVTSPADGVHPARSSAVSIPVAVLVAPPPPREKRLLWDQFRSVRYPPAYMPRDALEVGGSGDGGGGVGTQAAKARSTPPSLSLSRSSTTSWTGTATTPTQTCTARSTRCAARGMRWICWGRPPPASTLPITAPCSSSTRRTNSMTQKSTNWRPT